MTALVILFSSTLAFAGDVPAAPALSADAQSLLELLRLRDAPGCANLGAAGEAQRDALVALTAVESPPYVPLRAADCLVAGYAADPVAQGAMRGWMTDPEAAGLAMLVVTRLDALPEPLAVELARAALTTADSRWKSRFSERIAKSGNAAVRATLDTSPAPQ